MKLHWRPTLRNSRPFPRIFLSASIPSPKRNPVYLSGSEGQIEQALMLRVIETRVQDAVASLVTQVLRVGGQLICGGHPAITPMVAATVSCYSVDESNGETPIVLYQSEYFQTATPPVGRKEMEDAKLSRTIWVPGNLEQAGEKFSFAEKWRDNERFLRLRQGQADKNAKPELVDALVVMRLAMLLRSDPNASVSMGGMEGVEAEALLYRAVTDDTRPIFALRSTFGAAARLDEDGITFIDEEFLKRDKGHDPVELRPAADLQKIERHLLRRIRYDGIMRELVLRATQSESESPG
jgi:hypothetical protein